MIFTSLVCLALAAEPAARQPAFDINRALGRGVNLGNALEAPKEGEWGVTLREEYFDAIRQAGFDAVRIPTRWSAHAGDAAPFAIDPAFARRVDWAIDQAQARGLRAILNVHHFGEMDAEPKAALPKLLALWEQIGARYKDRPGSLVFEILNEPHDKLTDDLWQSLWPEVLKVIRRSNPERAVIIGPGHWNSLQALKSLELPEDDPNLIVTFHYYEPFKFTHQGAEWDKNAHAWLGTTWTGTAEQEKALAADLEKAAAWGKAHDRPMFLGEFGAYSKADMPSRARWTSAVARKAEGLGISWSYWEFCSGFGVYDPQGHAFREPIREALLPPK